MIHEASSEPYGDPRSYVELIPDAPLSTGWHILRVTDIPLDMDIRRSAVQVDGRTASVRFRTDSSPLLVAVDVCGIDQLATKLALSFSEPVQYVGTSAEPVTVSTSTGASAACVLPGPLTSAGVTLFSGLSLTCLALPRGEAVDVLLDPGLVGETGVAVSTLSGRGQTLGLTFVVDDLPVAGNCRSLSLR